MKPTKIATWRSTTPVENGDAPRTRPLVGSKASAPGTGGRIASRPNSMIADSTRMTAGTIARTSGGNGGASRRRLRAAPMTRITATAPRVIVQT